MRFCGSVSYTMYSTLLFAGIFWKEKQPNWTRLIISTVNIRYQFFYHYNNKIEEPEDLSMCIKLNSPVKIVDTINVTKTSNLDSILEVYK